MFKKKIFVFWLTLCILALSGVACAAASPDALYDGVGMAAESAPAIEVIEEVEEMAEFEQEAGDTSAITEEEVALEADSQTSAESVSTANQPQTAGRQRLIIKNGTIAVLVNDTAAAVNAVSNLAISTGGYIIEQRVYDSNGHTFATISIGVPVTEFERSMQVLRQLGVVLQDAASGQDVTEEYIDLESRLGNLEIKQERLRTFMEDASKIEDVIKLENELSLVEGELSVIKGRMKYLADRAAFSTINIQIDPNIPTPTMTPIPTPEAWRPADTAKLASVQAQESFQSSADFLIYNGIVCGPWLLLLAGLFYLFQRFYLKGRVDLASIRRPGESAVRDRSSEEADRE